MRNKIPSREVEHMDKEAVRAVIEDMRRHIPNHPPLAGPIKAFIDSYEKDFKQ